jgi:hypothetical protein
MTVAIAVKVYDGIVLATDSATTLPLSDGAAQVWNTAPKIFQLHRRHPVALMTWGLGVIGSTSVAMLAKDLRRRLMGADPAHRDWTLPHDYAVEHVADRLVDLTYDELYVPRFSGGPPPEPLGFAVAGFSRDALHPEVWLVEIDGLARRPAPRLASDGDQCGWLVRGQDEAAVRLLTGIDPTLRPALAAAVPAEHWPAVDAALRTLDRPLLVSVTPMGDVIALARYLVDVTAGYSRAMLGPDTVGGPVQVAALTRHEGFTWIERRHYYPAHLNPTETRHAC